MALSGDTCAKCNKRLLESHKKECPQCGFSVEASRCISMVRVTSKIFEECACNLIKIVSKNCRILHCYCLSIR